MKVHFHSYSEIVEKRTQLLYSKYFHSNMDTPKKKTLENSILPIVKVVHEHLIASFHGNTWLRLHSVSLRSNGTYL